MWWTLVGNICFTPTWNVWHFSCIGKAQRERGGKWGKKHGSRDIFSYIDHEGANVLFSQFKIKKPCCYTLTPTPSLSLSVLHTVSTSCNTHSCCLTIDWMSFAGDFCVRKYAQCLEQDQHSHVCFLPCLDLIFLPFSLCLAFYTLMMHTGLILVSRRGRFLQLVNPAVVAPPLPRLKWSE